MNLFFVKQTRKYLQSFQRIGSPLVFLLPIFLLISGIRYGILPWPFILSWAYLPVPSACLLIAIFVAVAIFGEQYLQSTYNFVLAVILFTLYMLLVPVELGDPWKSHLAHFPARLLWGSSILAHLLYKLVYEAGWETDYVAPVVGFFSALCFFRIIDEAKITFSSTEKAFSRIFYLCTTAHLLYFRGYTEITYPSVPFALLSILFLLRFLQRFQFHDYLLALLLLSLASLFHGQNIGLTPAYPILATGACSLLKRKEQINKILFSSIMIPVMTIGLFYLLLRFVFGFIIIPGDMYGGQSNVLFVPGKTFFSFFHPIYVVNLCFLACPATLTVFFLFSDLRATKSMLLFPFLFISSLFSVAYVCFIYIWRFDLGFPRDIHLMVSPSFSILMLSLLALLKIRRKSSWVAHTWLILSFLLCWTCISSLTMQSRQTGVDLLKLNLNSLHHQ